MAQPTGEEQEALMRAISGSSDKGSRVTLIGLATNIFLTFVKGIAGYLLSSASLLADAGHSLSDLVADFVTLFCWRWSRRPKNKDYPFGYGKYESVGSLVVAFLLLSGGSGIAFHSYRSFLPIISTWFPNHLDLTKISSSSHHPTHSHNLSESSDIRASYFALLSILAKEYLYRMTYKVGKSENSNVLIANALHHRSDAWSSLVALIAIVGSSLGYKILDPIGGFIVSSMILKGCYSIGKRSFEDLLDKRTDLSFDHDIENLIIDGINQLDSTRLNLSIDSIRHLKIGPDLLVFVEVYVTYADDPKKDNQIMFSSNQWIFVQQMLSRLIFKEKKSVKEVFVKFKLKHQS
ncbi:mitochondrial iron ion transporter [Phakopsora pachyrhizi]|uniref:Mitochondrial iron ion transporter n=1 Tax=Phakopsora pachyrhizi TaxID=170000 RepID=A0AAV0BSD0_PHAPC|nr:mitochondrial iron ion transporter [Phakopsora pachyrhizi]